MQHYTLQETDDDFVQYTVLDGSRAVGEAYGETPCEAEGRAALYAAAPYLLETLKTVLMAHDYAGAMTMGDAALSPMIRARVADAIKQAEADNGKS